MKDLSGKIFGRLTVLRYSRTNPSGHAVWVCVCQCGIEKEIDGTNLAHGVTKSCGCYRKEVTTAGNITHGSTGTKLFMKWQGMIARCANPKHKSYKYYGGRGIAVCDRWLSFENFIADMGERPSENHSIDRKDNNGNYDRNNCHWATHAEQMRNTRRNLFVLVDGEKMCVSDAAKVLGINRKALAKFSKSTMEPQECHL